jgi:hypothetical protein
MKLISKFLKTKRRGVEIIHCEDGSFCVLIHDATGAAAEGFAGSPDEAFTSALASYNETQRRAKLTTARYPRRPYIVTP